MEAPRSELDGPARTAIDAESFMRARLLARHRATDRLFAALLAAQGLLACLIAGWPSSRTGMGAGPPTLAMLGIGALVALPSIALGVATPGSPITRHLIAVGQITIGSVMVHMTQGRVDPRALVLVALTALALYRDVRVLRTATLVALAEELGQSALGLVQGGRWEWAGQLGWVLAADVVLAGWCLSSIEDLRELASREAELSATRGRTDAAVRLRSLELVQADARLKEVLEAATQVSIISTDLDGLITVFNSGAERMLGYTRAEMVGRATPEVIHLAEEVQEHAQRLTTELGRPIQGFGVFVERARQGAHEEKEWTYVRKDGSRLPVSLVVTALRGPGGRIGGYLGIATDISDRKRAERELRDAEARSRSILETVVDGIVTLDDHGRVDSLNPAAIRLFGYDPPELIGEDVARVMPDARPGRDPDGRWNGWSRLLTESERIVTGRRKDGGEFPMELGVSQYELGGRRMFAAVARDVTERLRAEEALRQAKAGAESANRAKSEFLANMSHEIRTPMNGILGMTELALDTPLSPRQREYLGLVRSSTDALLTLVDDILDFSKIEAGKLDLDRVPFGLRQLVEDTLRSLAVRADAKGLELSVRIDPELPDAVVGDPVRLRQVLVNLVGNAIKFTEAGEVVAAFEGEEDDDAELLLRLTVRDTGIGIAPEKLETIFEPFVQADGTTTRRFGGTGLGLTITHNLVGLMGGAIQVESEPGRGSVFHASIRLELQSVPSPSTAPRFGRLLDLPVLVVDDNATNRGILDELLRSWGARPRCVESGRAALASLRDAARSGQRYPLVLLDGSMPEFEGDALARQIDADSRLSGTILMMLASNDRSADSANDRSPRIAARLTKPIRQSELLETILHALGEARPDPPAALDRAVRSAPRRRILVAEDQLVNQKVIQGMLERLGHTVTLVGNGLEALAAIQGETFDLALVDIQMPELDGFATVAAVRDAERIAGTRLPMIALTAHAMKGDRERCLDAGFDGYLAKPLRWVDLEQTIAHHVRADPAPAASRADGPEPSRGPVFQRDEAIRQLGGDTELFREIVTLFVDDYPRLLGQSRDAVSRRDGASLRRAAHSLAGTAAHVGALEVVEAALALERRGAAAEFDGADVLIASLADAFDRFRQAAADLVIV